MTEEPFELCLKRLPNPETTFSFSYEPEQENAEVDQARTGAKADVRFDSVKIYPVLLSRSATGRYSSLSARQNLQYLDSEERHRVRPPNLSWLWFAHPRARLEMRASRGLKY